ncbi:MAG: TAT-variant-translocated molybdopterin oxidoreductase [Calditrichaceae bacterium]
MSTDQEKKYWKGIEERENTKEFQETLETEFPEPVSLSKFLEKDSKLAKSGLSRRSFLRAAGFTVTGSILASCVKGPVEKAIPLLNRQEEVVPGEAYWYASTCKGCSASCGILTKNSDGRPVKIEGNPEHPISKGGVCAVGQASILGLYDSQRLQKPMSKGTSVEWSVIDSNVGSGLKNITDGVYILTGTLTSPTTAEMINRFLKRFKKSGHVEYDAVSYSAIPDAHERTFGNRILPHYRFDQADVIVSFDADFLGTWISPVEFTKAYTMKRKPDVSVDDYSYHIQFEGRMSLTGSNADRRVAVTREESINTLMAIAERLSIMSGTGALPWASAELPATVNRVLVDDLADTLWKARGRSLIISGMNDVEAQSVVNYINYILGNYGKTIETDYPSYQWRGNDRAFLELVDKMEAGEVKVLIMSDVNPAYSYPDQRRFIKAIENVPLTISFSDHIDETSELVRYVCPPDHSLESWDDFRIAGGVIGVSQPVIPKLGDTRSFRGCLARWMNDSRTDLEIMQDYWKTNFFRRQNQESDFQKFWDKSVHDGFAVLHETPVILGDFRFSALKSPEIMSTVNRDEYEMVLYQKIGMMDGRHAHNPWLHELPDPVTKVVWDNYACMSPATAREMNIEQGDVVRLTMKDREIELPVLLQPGQHKNVISVALGYGRKGTDRFSEIGPQWLESRLTVEKGGTVGKNSFVFLSHQNRNFNYSGRVNIYPTGESTHLALTQTHQTITEPKHLGGHRRNMVRETVVSEFRNDPSSGNHFEHETLQLWENDHVYTGYHWGMSIDLNRCTGCSACVISCQAENNVQVVGKDEVYRRREMHWIRIDRYYSGDDGDVDVMHQPVMCQHCDHAPCEGVCPVLATVHSDEGINQQIYNRCVGTRYCANNCPYKVRRFNWFEYLAQEKKENLVLNPDVTTRSRGVMEKCSLCVQRIQDVKAKAKRENRPIADGEIKVACQQSCPADAIVFGDKLNPDSRIAKIKVNPRHYHMLEEMNFRPNVGYMTKVRNDKKLDGEI